MARGAVIDAYPYDFVNVVDRGYGPVSTTLAMILLFGFVVAAALWGVEVALRRRRSDVVPATD